jgi:dolichol kinase
MIIKEPSRIFRIFQTLGATHRRARALKQLVENLVNERKRNGSTHIMAMSGGIADMPGGMSEGIADMLADVGEQVKRL